MIPRSLILIAAIDDPVTVQCESGFIESPLSEINFLISLAWVDGGIDMGDPMLKIEKGCEGDRALPTPQKSEINSESFGFP